MVMKRLLRLSVWLNNLHAVSVAHLLENHSSPTIPRMLTLILVKSEITHPNKSYPVPDTQSPVTRLLLPPGVPLEIIRQQVKNMQVDHTVEYVHSFIRSTFPEKHQP